MRSDRFEHRAAIGRRLGDSEIRKKHRVTIVAVKKPGEGFTYATADTVVDEGDTLIASGLIEDAEPFSDPT
ncbi:cation:proton antiporter regulatory subunit [Jiangella anatolica]|uniref:RCK C-terminal domain-containing protein n=1 Tax=Jiangella anatolica TaxID=2670374 RepID=A0A2W2C5W7_9ACTN|nr:TrkA C-terminal domain-containing protein [Jiangella anatolica]PZF83629.1 hypothetical protein C1I92_11885 [Jiangella anatolica]